MKFKISEHNLALLLSAILLVVLGYFSIISEGSWGGADNYEHYKLARYAFSRPEFFLDHWGKPLFTLLSSPFAQFGFAGIKLFNLLIGIITGFICFKIAQKLNYANSILAIFFTVFTPVFLMMLFSSMTEVVFAFVLVASLYLFVKSKFLSSAIVLSFLPFARTEGIVIIPCFFIAFLYVRQYKALPFLLTGTIFYTIIGGCYYHDFLWLITKMPYGDASALYGHGGLFDFIKEYNNITGLIVGILLVVGSAHLIVLLLKRKNSNESIIELLLIFAPFFCYLSFHSFLWWKGMGGSLGLIRVMAGVMPLAGLLALKGWNLLVDNKFLSTKFLKTTLSFVLVFFVIQMTITKHRLPVNLDDTEKLIKETADWLKESEYYTKKMYYYEPLFYLMLDINPYDTTRLQELVPDKEKPENGMAVGELVLWDAHFGPNEGGLPLKRLQENTHFRMLKSFSPEYPFTVLGGYNYEIYVFQKVN